MTSLKNAYAAGRSAALARFKLAEAPKSAMPSSAMTQLQAPTNPAQLAATFNAQEQVKTQQEPQRKLSAVEMCTTCRKEKHYGPCLKPTRTRPDGVPQKKADFNMNMTGSDPSNGNNPSTSAHYHSATTADSSLARARDGRPADEQASSAFADLYRHLGISSAPDEAMNTTNALNKVGQTPGMGDGGMYENRGPTVDPYTEQRPLMLSPPVAWGDEGLQRIRRAFGQIDNTPDSINVDGGTGTPAGEPAALG